MTPELLQALGWVWCMVGLAWHVRRAPAIVRRPILGPQPLTVTLERVGGDGVRATGRLEVDPGVEATAVLAALSDVWRSVEDRAAKLQDGDRSMFVFGPCECDYGRADPDHYCPRHG